MKLPTEVHIREVGPREGFQTIVSSVPTASKLEVIEALSQTGLRSIELTSLVRADRVPQMADAEELVRSYKRHDGVSYPVLYLNHSGFKRALSIRDRIDLDAWLPLSVSEVFLQQNNNTSTTDFLARIPEWSMLFREAGFDAVRLMVSTAFGYHDDPITPERLAAAVLPVRTALSDLRLSVSEVCLADTVGLANPEQVRQSVRTIRAAVPGAEVSLHLHDTRGSGMANVYAGLLEGVSTFDSSIGGLGGCPFAQGAAGNVPTEDVVYLCESLGITTGVRLEALVHAARIAARVTGVPLTAKYSRIGW